MALQIEYRRPDELAPYAKNSRTHSGKQIAQIEASIREFGFTNPLLIDEHGGIIAGHGRLAAATNLKLESIPCITLAGLTDAQKRAYVIADNKLALNAGWDEALLAAELKHLQAEDYDVGVMGFSDKELQDILGESEGKYDEDADGDISAPPAQPVSQPGDIWILGEHRLICGDATSTSDIDALLAGEKADMVWTDPPYNVAIVGKAGSIKNDDMDDGDFARLLAGAYRSCHHGLRMGGVIYIAHADFERVNFTREFVAAGFKLSQVLIWVKQSATLSRQDFNWQHEPILYGWKEGESHHFCRDFTLTTVIDDERLPENLSKEELVALVNQYRDAMPGTAIRYNRPTKSELHPTMKPVGLVERMIRWSSRPGDIVMDVFGGSGSTLIACEKTDRRARLVELDPKFCDVIIKRWQSLTEQHAVHKASGKTFEELSNNGKKKTK